MPEQEQEPWEIEFEKLAGYYDQSTALKLLSHSGVAACVQAQVAPLLKKIEELEEVAEIEWTDAMGTSGVVGGHTFFKLWFMGGQWELVTRFSGITVTTHWPTNEAAKAEAVRQLRELKKAITGT